MGNREVILRISSQSKKGKFFTPRDTIKMISEDGTLLINEAEN